MGPHKLQPSIGGLLRQARLALDMLYRSTCSGDLTLGNNVTEESVLDIRRCQRHLTLVPKTDALQGCRQIYQRSMLDDELHGIFVSSKSLKFIVSVANNHPCHLIWTYLVLPSFFGHVRHPASKNSSCGILDSQQIWIKVSTSKTCKPRRSWNVL